MTRTQIGIGIGIGIAAALALAGCGKKDKDGAGSSGGAGGGDVDVAPANKAIPAAWKGKLEFVARTITNRDESATVPAPKDWKVGFLKDTLEPAEGNKAFGFATSFRAGKTCGGECKAKPAAEWEQAATSSFFGNMLAHKPPPKVLKDEKSAGKRVLIAEDQYTDGNQNKTVIMMAWWKDGADRLYYCTVDLAPESKELVGAFEQACAKLAVDL